MKERVKKLLAQILPQRNTEEIGEEIMVDPVYSVPDEICQMFIDSHDTEATGQAIIKEGTNLLHDAAKMKREAWEKVYDLYPDLKDKKLNFNTYTRKVTVLEGLPDEK